VEYHGTVAFTITPSSGYDIASVTGCGGTLNGNTYTTGAITADCTVSALFGIKTYTVTPSAGAGGTINPSIAQTVNHGSTMSFSISPDTGYDIASVTGCGGTLNGNTYTTGAITVDCTVSATFAIKSYTLTVNTAGSGSGTVTGAGTYTFGTTVTVAAAADTGSTFAGWSGDCSGTDNPTTVLMDGPKTCTATFLLL
jgi:uncharacterized repeat protein (TIGR02543 family)